MTLDDLLHGTGEWMRGSGPESDIVMSSRIRLARNLEGQPFAHRATEAQQAKVAKAVKSALPAVKFLKGAMVLSMSDISVLDREFLVERNLISPEMAAAEGKRVVVIGEKEMVSLMVNEEDHLRLQMMEPGLQLADAWRLAERIDVELESKLGFATMREWGYLTACPTNVGTGMRASVMLHLPALVMTKQISNVLRGITQLGLVARGMHGEGTEPAGNLFQVSNQTSLGKSEDEIIDDIERMARQISGREQVARKMLLKRGQVRLEDRVWRARGLLTNARVISSSEALDLLSALRLGVDMGIANGIPRGVFNELFVLIQPAHIQKLGGEALKAADRDQKRSDVIREKLGKRRGFR